MPHLIENTVISTITIRNRHVADFGRIKNAAVFFFFTLFSQSFVIYLIDFKNDNEYNKKKFQRMKDTNGLRR